MSIVTGTEAWVLLLVLASSLSGSFVLVLTQKWHGRVSLDHDTTGIQKIHRLPVPRVGGIGIAFSLAIGAIVCSATDSTAGHVMPTLLVCALPAFAAGLLEDLTKRVSVRARLLASFASALAAVWLLDAQLFKLDTPGLDTLMGIAPLAVLFTCFAVSGVTNAINIVDGLNGLASGSVAIMLGGLGAMAWMQGDLLVLQLCLAGVAAMLGFMVLNFPFGKIFLGDGGAYLAGFWLAECAVLLLTRNPDISTWGVLLVCFYPVWETAFSMYRRMLNKAGSGSADMQHLHHLVLHQVLNTRIGRNGPDWVLHGLATPVCWLMVVACLGMALSNHQNTPLLMLGTIVFAVVYQWLYKASHHRSATPSLR